MCEGGGETPTTSSTVRAHVIGTITPPTGNPFQDFFNGILEALGS